jgi:hypothetical protein
MARDVFHTSRFVISVVLLGDDIYWLGNPFPSLLYLRHQKDLPARSKRLGFMYLGV